MAVERTRLWLKGCPRCHGDLASEPCVELEGPRRRTCCVQCGYELTERQQARLSQAERLALWHKRYAGEEDGDASTGD